MCPNPHSSVINVVFAIDHLRTHDIIIKGINGRGLIVCGKKPIDAAVIISALTSALINKSSQNTYY